MNQDYYAVIMAGGGGTRMWPISRSDQPKQMLNIMGNRSFFQMAVDRLEGLFDSNHITVVTVEDQVNDLISQVPKLLRSNFFIEPLPRGTASVVGFAAVCLLKRNKNAVMAVLTADHIIKNIPGFQNILKKAHGLAQEGYLVTIGIEPNFPSTGYGYIYAGDKLEKSSDVYNVVKFIEKPNRQKAEEFLQNKNYYWNSGMFIWRADKILEEFKRQMPRAYEILLSIYNQLGSENSHTFINEIWPTIENQTIDYGIMENANRVIVIPARQLEWSDVGSWDSLYELLDADENGNVNINGLFIHQEAKNTLIYSENPEKLIALIGLEDLIVVESEKALLLCKKGEGQKVKDLIEKMKDDNLKGYL